jgi:transposase
MPKSCKLTSFEKGEIVGLSKGGHSVRNISKILDKPKSTVQDVITKYNEKNRMDATPRSGRPLALPEQDKRQLGRIVRQNHKQTVEEISEQFNQGLTISVSSRTV